MQERQRGILREKKALALVLNSALRHVTRCAILTGLNFLASVGLSV